MDSDCDVFRGRHVLQHDFDHFFKDVEPRAVLRLCAGRAGEGEVVFSGGEVNSRDEFVSLQQVIDIPIQ